MDILQHDDGKKGSFYIKQGDETIAEMSYVWAGTKLIIDHTEVSPVLAGQGVGRKLLNHVVELAREKNIKIMPLCPYAKSVFDKDTTIRDVLF